MLRHAALGFVLGVVGAAIIVATDALNLRSLAVATPMGWLGLSIFCFLMGLTIGSLQIGFAVMLQGRDDEHDDPKGGHGARLVPIPVPVHRRRR
ncbi:hypothetical protein CHU95_11965 [Niveispirillum lacus]|uniref:Uncharacterized protein n=2 Tax=Niveispirillum lacus TaxID=1981099 RepID=A0A255YYB4_9PROT|nr:hypothetical protein CHU95_11965 [Niveispirillum lacus]